MDERWGVRRFVYLPLAVALLIDVGCGRRGGDASDVERLPLANAPVPGSPIDEPALAVNPRNPNEIALVSMVRGPGGTFCVARVSISGPTGFTNSIPLNGTSGCGDDSSISFDADGNVYAAFLQGGFRLAVQRIQVDGLTGAGMAVDAAGDDCAAGGNPSECPIAITDRIDPGTGQPFGTGDKPWVVADSDPQGLSPLFRNRVYFIWATGFKPGSADPYPNSMLVTSSADRGSSWTAAVDLTLPLDPTGRAPDGQNWGPHITVGPTGDVYATFHSQPTIDVYGQIDRSGRVVVSKMSANPLDPAFGQFVRSTDAIPAFPTINLQMCLCTPTESCPNDLVTGYKFCSRRLTGFHAWTFGTRQPRIMVDALAPSNVAVVYSTDPTTPADGGGNDDLDVRVARSTDGGATWLPATTVPAPAGAGNMQVFPVAAGAIDSHCLTVGYYNASTQPTGSETSQLDVYAVVSPDFGASWLTAPMRLNQTPVSPDLLQPGSDVTGNPNPGGPWQPTPRMGEYFAILHGAVATWMGNDPSLGEQTTIYSEFSDVVPPTVTSVPHRGPFVDCPTVTLSGQALATDLCGLPPLTVAGAGTTPAGMTFDATIPTTLKLPPGDTTIAWSATDGALNRSAAVIETITTTDVSPPTIGTRPAVTVETCSAGQTTVTLTPPTATDSCHPAPPVTGTVISLTPNVPVVDGQVSLPPGSHTVRWTASDGAGHTASSTQTVVVQPGILTKGQFLLRDRAQVQVVSGGPGGVGNAGSTLTEAGNDTRLGDIVSVARVLLRDRVTVQGAIRSASTITLGNGDVISGPIVPSTPVTLPPVPDLTGVVFPPPTGGNRTFNTTTTLAPGSYGSVTLNSPARVSLSAGSYFFQQLTLNSGASLVIPAAGVVKLFVSGGLAYRSQVIHSGGQAAQIFLGYNGTASPVLEAQFQGTLIAPRATVSMGTASARQFRGRFFARGLEIRPDARIVCDTTVTAR